MADIPVNIVAKGNLAQETIKAAAGMQLLSERQERVNKVAKMLGKTEKEVAAGIRESERAEASAEKAAVKREKAKEAAIRKRIKLEKQAEREQIAAIRGMSRIEMAKERAFKKELGDIRDLLSGDITPLLEGFGPGIAPAVAVTGALVSAFVAASVAAVGLLGVVGALALKAGTARDETKAMLEVLTAGRGEETLGLLDGLAKQLGASISDTRAKFIEFRKAGFDNSQSANLIKLSADLRAVGLSAEDAEAGIKKIVTQATKADGSIDPKVFKEAFQTIAGQARVAGDGIAAAEKNAKSFAGAMNRLENVKTQALEATFDRIGPSLDKAASKLAGFAEAFLKSEKGKAAIDFIARAFEKLPGVIQAAVTFVSELMTQLAPLGPVLSETGVILGNMFKAFGSGGSAASGAAAVLGHVLVGVVAAFALLIQTAALVVTAIWTFPENLKGVVTAAIDLFSELGTAAVGFGKSIIDGLINGIKAAAGALFSAVGSIASGVKNTFKSVLRIESPSKEFMKLGAFTSEGFEIGMTRNAPDSASVAKGLLDAPAAPTLSGGSGSSQSISVGDIYVTIAGGDTPQATGIEFAAAIRRELMTVLSGQSLAVGNG